MLLTLPIYTGWTNAVRATIKFASALVGNIPGVQDPGSHDSLFIDDKHFLHSNHDQATTDHSSLQEPLSPFDDSNSHRTFISSPAKDNPHSGCQHLLSVESFTTQMCAVKTRAGRPKRIHPLVLPKIHPLSVTLDDFHQLQESCPSLKYLQMKVTILEVENCTTYQGRW